MKYSVIALFLALSSCVAAAGSLEDALLKLEPEERSHQACIAKGIDEINRANKKLRVDRLKTSIFSRAKFDGTTVTAPGGAFRAKHKWFKLKFTCDVTENKTLATKFEYELGPEIPKNEWEDLGLWE
jgi:hypothetical protein